MKIVMIVNKELPVGLAANTAAVLGISLGKEAAGIVGPDCTDGSGIIHKGITEKNIPVLAADSDGLKEIYAKSIRNDRIDTIDFNRIAQSCKDYSDYASQLSGCANTDIELSGLCLSGPEKEIARLTGALGLYR